MRFDRLVVALCLACLPAAASAQTVLLAAYNCAADQLTRADALVNEFAAPILNKHVAAGTLLRWGYIGVYVGNQNNRSVYIWAADPVALLQARAEYLPEMAANPASLEFVKICGSATLTIHNLITAAPAPGR